jgi:hypothetical protein
MLTNKVEIKFTNLKIIKQNPSIHSIPLFVGTKFNIPAGQLILLLSNNNLISDKV